MTDTMQQLLVRFPADMLDQLKRHADDEDRSVAAEVRRAVRQYLEGLDGTKSRKR